jgi:hypothetical protein
VLRAVALSDCVARVLKHREQDGQPVTHCTTAAGEVHDEGPLRYARYTAREDRRRRLGAPQHTNGVRDPRNQPLQERGGCIGGDIA